MCVRGEIESRVGRTMSAEEIVYIGYWCVDCDEMLQPGCTKCEDLYPVPRTHEVIRVKVVGHRER